MEDLANVDFKKFRNLEEMAFSLDNGTIVNRRANEIVREILQERVQKNSQKKSLEQSRPWDEYFSDFLTDNGNSCSDVGPLPLLAIPLTMPVMLAIFLYDKASEMKSRWNLKTKIKNEAIMARAYQDFLDLREKIEEAYRNVETSPYRSSPPAL